MGYVETECTVIHTLYRYTDGGAAGYQVIGEELPYCSTHRTKHHTVIYKTTDATTDGLKSIFPLSYITESLYALLTPFEIRAIRDSVIGIIQDNYYYSYYWGETPFGDSVYCFARKSDAAIRPVPPLGPCDGISCENICTGYDLWTQKCVDGTCVDDALVEQNSPTCGYVPPDPCEGVVCDPLCHDYNLWTQKCIDGSCVDDIMLEENSTTCGYVPPEESDWYDPVVDNWGYIFLLIVAGVAIDHVLERPDDTKH